MISIHKRHFFYLQIALLIMLFSILTCKRQTALQRTTEELSPPPTNQAAENEGSQRKNEKTPIFKTEAIITMANGEKYELKDFAFYDARRAYNTYWQTSGSTDWPLYVKQGVVWKSHALSDVKSIEFADVENDKWSWYKIKMAMTDGSTLIGLHPRNHEEAWYKDGIFYLIGQVKIMSRTGEFKCPLDEISKIERFDSADAMIKVNITDKKGKQTPVTDPKFIIEWSRVPNWDISHDLTSEMQFLVQDRIKVDVKLAEMDSISFPRAKEGYLGCIIKLKNGETVSTELDPERLFGKLENGDIFFTYIWDKPYVNMIQFR